MATPTRTERLRAMANEHLEAARYMVGERRFDDAEAQYRQAAALLEDAGDRAGEQDAWLRAGLSAQKRGDLTGALEAIAKSIALARAEAPSANRALAIALGHRAAVAIAQGQADAATEAAAAYREALAIAEALGELAMIGAFAGNLGQLELRRGALDEADQAFARAEVAYEAAQDGPGLGATAIARGELARARGDLDTAQDHFQRAVSTCGPCRDLGGLALALSHLGNLARDKGELAHAEEIFRASRDMARADHDEPAVARAATNLGNLAAQRGDYPTALGHYEAALVLDKRHGQAQAIIGGLVNVASVYIAQGHFAEARAHYAEAAKTLAPMRIPRTEADVLALLGQVTARMGELELAETHFQAALGKARAAGYARGEIRLHTNLSALAHARGDIVTALAGYRAALAATDRAGAGSPVSDRITIGLVLCDAALAHADLTAADAALAEATALLADPTQREALDLDAMRARITFVRTPDDAGRAALLAAADALEAAGRPVDALGARLIVLDRGTASEHDQALAVAVSEAADAFALAPLRIDARSTALVLGALAPTADARVAALRDLLAEAAALQLGLLALRVERRLADALADAGDTNQAHAIRAAAARRARASGALAEAERLEAGA